MSWNDPTKWVMQYTGAVFAPILGGPIEKYGFATIYTIASIIIVAVAIITSVFIWDAKDHYKQLT